MKILQAPESDHGLGIHSRVREQPTSDELQDMRVDSHILRAFAKHDHNFMHPIRIYRSQLLARSIARSDRTRKTAMPEENTLPYGTQVHLAEALTCPHLAPVKRLIRMSLQ